MLDVMHRPPEPGLEPEGEPVPAAHHQLVLAPILAAPILARHPRPRLRSYRHPLHAAPASGRYSLPRPVLDRLQVALAPAKNREAALVLAVFLARYWSAPTRLGQAFPIDRRAMCGARNLGLTEAKIRGAIRLLEEVGFLERSQPEPGRRYRRTDDGSPIRRPILFHFGAEYGAAFLAARRWAPVAARRAPAARQPRV